MNKLRLIAIAAAASCFAAMPASAALLIGKTVNLLYVFPTSTTTYEGPYANTVGTTGTTTFFGLVGATPGDTTLDLTFTSDGTFLPTSFNGVRLDAGAAGANPFTSVTINAATNVVGFDASRVTFDATNIYLNLQALSVDSASVIQVDITGAETVPEPAAWTLMIGGFGLVGGAMRRRPVAVAA